MKWPIVRFFESVTGEVLWQNLHFHAEILASKKSSTDTYTFEFHLSFPNGAICIPSKN